MLKAMQILLFTLKLWGLLLHGCFTKLHRGCALIYSFSYLSLHM